ncbi:MAG: DNA-formamidopyrimidine glycosylase family protein [Actinomycetota bacterium]|nr:DNA-formamidopyrimidine glycosylase family protein [Actinomycetota bacterium]
MPELPEVEALARFLHEHTAGLRISKVTLASFSALKTYDPTLADLEGQRVHSVTRVGKFLDMKTDSGLHLVWHLSRAGWVHWREELSAMPVKMGKGPLALRLAFVRDDDELAGGFDVTEAGTQKRLAVYIVNDPRSIPGVERLGPDALSDGLTLEAFTEIVNAAGRAQLKGVLRNQSVIAGIGNAYSDEILHSAGLSPFRACNSLKPEELATLYAAMRKELTDAIQNSIGHGTGTLKSEKKRTLAVHGKSGEQCPTCGDTVREVSFADSSLQYCPTCQTGGKLLADRRTSKFLK